MDRSLIDGFAQLRPIRTKGDLKRHLQVALKLEHATIPPYLCALYTLKDTHTTGANLETYGVIARVVYEEMLHLSLVGNLLNAIGGQPRFTTPTFVLQYPAALPGLNGAFEVSLEKASDGALDTFLQIEKPQYPVLFEPLEDRGYDTIGEFYAAISAGFGYLNGFLGPARLFSGDRSRQVVRPMLFNGKLIDVFDLDSAKTAINTIVSQGEGNQIPGPLDPTSARPHYFAFRDIRTRSIRGADGHILSPGMQFNPQQVVSMAKNPREHGPNAAALSHDFDVLYFDLLAKLEDAFNGTTDHVDSAITAMYWELRPAFLDLLAQQLPGGLHAGPTLLRQYPASAPQVEKTIRIEMRDPEVRRQAEFEPGEYPNGRTRLVRAWDVSLKFNTAPGSPILIKTVQTFTNGGGPMHHFDFPSADGTYEATPFSYTGSDGHGCVVLERRSTPESALPEFVASNDPFPQPNSIYPSLSVRRFGRWLTLEWWITVVEGEPQVTLVGQQQAWVSSVTLRTCPTA